MDDCQSECDCGWPGPAYGPHDPDCHVFWKCDEGQMCDKHTAEAIREHNWMRGKPLSAVTGVMDEADKQDMRDAGRGHLVRE